jgi:hypothetical protein
VFVTQAHIRDIRRPYLIGMRNGEITYEVRIPMQSVIAIRRTRRSPAMVYQS